jgi:type I restriction enzyme, S subunit
MNVPQLRFPEFVGEWEEKPLSSAWHVKGKRNFDNAFGKEQVLSVSGEKGVVNQIEHLGRSYAGVLVDNYHVVEKGDMVYTKSPLKSNPFGIIKVNKGKAGIVSTLYAVYEVKDQNDPEFWDRYFELDDRTNGYLMPLVHIGAKNDMKINNERVLIDPVFVPTHAEQKKIAAFLGVVDAKIAALRARVLGLETYKRGLLQALFSQSVRFTKPDGTAFPDWEEKRLGEVATITKGKGIAKADISEDGVLSCIRYGELYTLYSEVIHRVVSRTNVHTSDLVLSQSSDVIIPASGEDPKDMANASCVRQEGVALGGDLNIIRGEFHGTFLAYYLRGAKRSEIAKIAQGNSVCHLYGAQLRALRINLPHPDEQAKIADALQALDAKIAAVQAQVDRMQDFKRGLLQQMFV